MEGEENFYFRVWLQKVGETQCQNWIHRVREKATIRCKILVEKYIKDDESRAIIDEPHRLQVSDANYRVGMEEYMFDDNDKELTANSIVSEKESKSEKHQVQ